MDGFSQLKIGLQPMFADAFLSRQYAGFRVVNRNTAIRCRAVIYKMVRDEEAGKLSVSVSFAMADP